MFFFTGKILRVMFLLTHLVNKKPCNRSNDAKKLF